MYSKDDVHTSHLYTNKTVGNKEILTRRKERKTELIRTKMKKGTENQEKERQKTRRCRKKEKAERTKMKVEIKTVKTGGTDKNMSSL